MGGDEHFSELFTCFSIKSITVISSPTRHQQEEKYENSVPQVSQYSGMGFTSFYVSLSLSPPPQLSSLLSLLHPHHSFRTANASSLFPSSKSSHPPKPLSELFSLKIFNELNFWGFSLNYTFLGRLLLGPPNLGSLIIIFHHIYCFSFHFTVFLFVIM